MIDTIKVKIPISFVDWATVQGQCDKSERSSIDNPNKRAIHFKQLVLEKRAKVQITLGKEDSIFAEFSIPKYLNGHNVFILPPDEPEIALADLQNVLIDEFGITVPDYNDWILRRTDFCYAWRSQDDDIASTILSGLKPYLLPRKDQIIYPSTIYWRGATKTTKFYLKHPEFMVKDYKELMKWGFIELAENIANESIGVLRYEVELRDEAITALFGSKDTPVSKLLHEFSPMTYLQDSLQDLLGVRNDDLSNWPEVYTYIQQTSTPRQVWPRFSQLLASISEDPVIKNSLNSIPKSTRKRNEQYFREHNLIALPFTLPYNYRLEIPSPLEPLPTVYE